MSTYYGITIVYVIFKLNRKKIDVLQRLWNENSNV